MLTEYHRLNWELHAESCIVALRWLYWMLVIRISSLDRLRKDGTVILRRSGVVWRPSGSLHGSILLEEEIEA
jgi:hypothetical protein